MKYYSHIHLENLKTIQTKVFDVFLKKSLLEKDSLFYLPNNLDIFMNIPELKKELDNLNWTNYVNSFGFYMINKSYGTPLHIDSGTCQYSFNIPILNCENTFINFYKTNAEPVKSSYMAFGKLIDYYKYNVTDCVLQDKLEMTTPHVINVKEVHNVTNLNSLSRITLLIRLKKEINLDHLFQ